MPHKAPYTKANAAHHRGGGSLPAGAEREAAEACVPNGEVQALLFDFNGTLCDDAPGLVRIYRQIAQEAHLPLPDSLLPAVMGLPDNEVFSHLLRLAGLPPEDRQVATLTGRRRELYWLTMVSSPPITHGRRQLMRKLAAHVPLGLVSGAYKQEISAALSAAQLDDVFTAIVAIDDVTHGKPDPEGWLLGLARINGRLERPIPASRVLAVDDSADGLRAARRAGMRTAAVSNGVTPAPRAEADLHLGVLDKDAEASLLAVIEAATPHQHVGRPGAMR